MTHDELQALAERWRAWDSMREPQALAQAYLESRKENAALSVKLEAAQADRDAANQAATRIAREAAMAPGATPCPSCHTLLLVRGETAQPEVIKACPQCGCHQGQVEREGPTAWWCTSCDNEYSEPAIYQKVKGGSA